jgi:hypothetical protein
MNNKIDMYAKPQGTQYSVNMFSKSVHTSPLLFFETKSCSILRADLCYEMSVNHVSPYNSRDLAQ